MTAVAISTSALLILWLRACHFCLPRVLLSRCRLRGCALLRLIFRFPIRRPLPGSRHCSLPPTARGQRHLGYDRGVSYELRRERVALGVLDATSAAALLESSVTLAERHTVFGRAEIWGERPPITSTRTSSLATRDHWQDAGGVCSTLPRPEGNAAGSRCNGVAQLPAGCAGAALLRRNRDESGVVLQPSGGATPDVER